tara:strand:+ start:905 stop:1027 length:123 start_codon:yes stop_codon:yes gene_type:complete
MKNEVVLGFRYVLDKSPQLQALEDLKAEGAELTDFELEGD